jgi:8-oxo-dGTP diphosphatase
MENELSKIYGKRLRIRVCGLLQADGRLLLVNHRLPDRQVWWAPPGGGVEFGETLEQTLRREFEEETNLRITVGQFAFGCEYLHDPLHAIELFFWVSRNNGVLKTGDDPELALIADVRYLSMNDLSALPSDQKHGIFQIARSLGDLQQLKGFYRV